MHSAPETANSKVTRSSTSGKLATDTYRLTEPISESHPAVFLYPHPPSARFSVTLERYTAIGNLRRKSMRVACFSLFLDADTAIGRAGSQLLAARVKPPFAEYYETREPKAAHSFC
jgi:hypothetical protein